jgi:class 3 adenylate cyclase/predicted ATPase
MPPVDEWLRSLGLSEYAGSFEEHRIDLSVLPDLTDQDLKELGVAALGDRRRILRAIAELAAAGFADDQRGTSTDTSPRDTAERRQVTVMFADLVNSTALSTAIDPEDLRDVISEYQKCVASTVRDFGGYVARYAGDGALVYFGYPQAHEDDAERAVGAALALIEAVANIETRSRQRVRVGIATGLVVVGHLISSGEADERGIFGETPNLAARLQSIAAPNVVVIAESTRRLLGDLFLLEDLGTRELKGIIGPVRAWAVLQPSSVASRFEALHPTGVTALVGREEETEILLRRWSKVRSGEGQVVLLSGEAGVGKSRLTADVEEIIAREPHTRLRCFCSPQHTNSALHPIIRQMGRAAGLAHDDMSQRKLDKLDLLLNQTSTPAHDAALLAEMLSLPNDGRYPILELPPQQRRQKTLEALIVQLIAVARSYPVLMVFEDAHWADPTSLELLGRMVERIQTRRVLLIVTFRPEFEPSWIGYSHVSSVILSRLAPRHVGVMIEHIVGNKPLPANIRQDIIERTDGIPLFVEEMTKAVLEAETESEAQRTAAQVPSPLLSVPPSLHASLMARLDRLGAAREVAQIGAAIGREFSHSLLAAVACKPEASLRSALNNLNRAGLLFQRGVPPDATYLFKHALVQDAAYGLLLREPRRALHARIAEILETRFTELAENQPELLARHYTEAGQIEKAAGQWGRAGQRSAQRSALVEAADQLKRALDQIATLPTTPARRREEIKLQVARISPLLPVKGYAAPETRAAVERARQLIEQAEVLGEPPEDPLLLFSVLYGGWVANYVEFKGDAMRELAAEFLALANKQGAATAVMIGHRLMGLSLLVTGDLENGRAHLDQAIALYNPNEHRPLTARFGQDVRVASLSLRSWALCALGFRHDALLDTEQALSDAREIGQAATLMYALLVASISHVICSNYVEASAIIDELVALTDEIGSSFWKAWAVMQKGCVLALTDKASDAVQTIHSGMREWRSTGSTAMMPYYLSYLAEAHKQLGQFDAAEQCISEAMAAVEATKERWCEAEIYRIAGEIALLSSEHGVAKAEVHLIRALAIAREQRAKHWELRAAMGIARLWRDNGKRDQGRDLLCSVYSWFPEDADSIELQQAKKLLEDLSQ